MEHHKGVLQVGSGTAEHPAALIDPGECIETYILGMRWPGTWGGEPELFAATQHLGVAVRLWRQEQSSFLLIQHYLPAVVGQTTLDVIWMDGNHYNIFLPHVVFPGNF